VIDGSSTEELDVRQIFCLLAVGHRHHVGKFSQADPVVGLFVL